MNQKPAIGIGIAALVAGLCLAALASDSTRIEKPAAVDAEQYADFIDNEIFDIQDLAEGAEIQRRRFNRMTPPGFSWVQPMFPSVVPFDAENFDEKFLGELLGEDKNSVAIYPLSLTQDPKTRETLVFNAEGKQIATIPADKTVRYWPEDADPARVTLLLDLLPAEDVEPYLYTESRIADYAETLTAKATKSSGMVLRSLGASEFGIAGVQRLTNGSMRITVTNGADTAEVYAYTVWHTSTITTNEWVDEYGVTNISTNTLWTPVSSPFNGIESEWECLTTNLALSGGVGVYEDANIASNARVRFYAVANRLDTDNDGLTDGAEIFIHRTDPGNPDTDGDGWSDTEELAEETDPLDRFSAAKLARGVVLNEVLYDAAGTDLGKEWIELYSAGRYPVDVGGFVVQVADTAFSNAYVFPSNTWIDPGRFLLLGGSLVTNRDLEVDFTMPNRFTNDPTAAVRLAAEVGTNTFVADCLMYGGNAANFNPYGLDTTGWISTNARSAGAGNSLFRLFAGHDTDQVLDWYWKSGPVPNSSSDIPDSDGDGLTDQEELTGSLNPYGEPTDRHNADSDGDGLSDYAECITYGTNPNTWATDGDIFPWPPPSGSATNWWGSDSYEIANGWNPLVFDENTNGIPDSWEMAFPGTNLYADADGDGISNFDELMQNSNPFNNGSLSPQPYVLRFESSMPGWAHDGMTDVGLKGWVKTYFEGLKTNLDLCAWVKEGQTQEQFRVEWIDATLKGISWLNDNREVVTSASAGANSRPCLLVQDLGLHPNYTNTLGGEYEIDMISVCFLGESGNEVGTLSVGKWENAFNAGPTVKDNFIDLDPDRFLIQAKDPSKRGAGSITVQLSTDSDGTAYDDDATEITLTEEPFNSGVFISTNMLLVSDDVDDDFTNSSVVADDSQNDRTHKIAIGGKVIAQYSCAPSVNCTKEASVPPYVKTVDVSIIILRDKPASSNGVPVIDISTVTNFWTIAKDRYAQVGINVNWTGPTIEDPPAGVDLSDDLLYKTLAEPTIVAPETKALINALGTTNTTADIHVFYVNHILAYGSRAGGVAIGDYAVDESEENYTYNIILSGSISTPWGGYAAAHELGHLLTDTGHPTSDTWRLMHGNTLTTTGCTGSRRFTESEENSIRGNSHAY